MVIAYLRVTTGKQHLEKQRDEIERFALDKRIQVDKWLTDIVDDKRKVKDPSFKPCVGQDATGG